MAAQENPEVGEAHAADKHHRRQPERRPGLPLQAEDQGNAGGRRQIDGEAGPQVIVDGLYQAPDATAIRRTAHFGRIGAGDHRNSPLAGPEGRRQSIRICFIIMELTAPRGVCPV